MSHVAQHVAKGDKNEYRVLSRGLLDRPVRARPTDMIDVEIPYPFERGDEAPNLAKPSGDWKDRQASFQSLNESSLLILGWLSGVGADLRKACVSHHVFGLMGGIQWLLFAAAPIERHRAQPVGFNSYAGFPGSWCDACYPQSCAAAWQSYTADLPDSQKTCVHRVGASLVGGGCAASYGTAALGMHIPRTTGMSHRYRDVYMVLIHSPLVPRMTMQPLARSLQDLGCQLLVPRLSNNVLLKIGHQEHHAAEVERACACPHDRVTVAVVHSGAGTLLHVLDCTGVTAYALRDAIFADRPGSRLDFFDDQVVAKARRGSRSVTIHAFRPDSSVD